MTLYNKRDLRYKAKVGFDITHGEMGEVMDIAQVPIVDFLKYCKEGARNCGYSWIICILSRARDSKDLYKSIERDWQSLDSITGKSMLVLLAGNEVGEDCLYEKDPRTFCVTDKEASYVKRYNPFATVIGNRGDIKADLSSERYGVLKNHIKDIEGNQTDAINSLRKFFGINEHDIPCLVYYPIHEEMIPVRNIVVPFPDGEVDLYAYFKKIFNVITPLVDELTLGNELQEKIDKTYDKLILLVNQSQQRAELMEFIRDKKYAKVQQPIRGLLSKYIDLCKNYQKAYGVEYSRHGCNQPALLSEIENKIGQIGIPVVKEMPLNAYISIGNSNRIKNTTISVGFRESECRKYRIRKG